MKILVHASLNKKTPRLTMEPRRFFKSLIPISKLLVS